MRRYFAAFFTVSVFVASTLVFAQTGTPTKVKLGSTGQAGSTHQSDVPYEGDPLGNKPVDAKWDAGAPSTQAPYTEDCKEDRCVRAKQRQTGDSTWQEDRATGLHKSSSY